MTSKFVKGLEQFHLPRLLLVDLPSPSSADQASLSDRDRLELEVVHAQLSRIRDNPDSADMELFGGIARSVTSNLEETEKAVELMRPMFTDAAARLKRDIQGELAKYICQDFLMKVVPQGTIPNDPVRLMTLAFPVKTPETDNDVRRMWESRLLYYMTLQTLGMLLRDDPTYRNQLLSRVETVGEDVPAIDTVPYGPVQNEISLRTIMDADDIERVIDFLLAQGLIVDKGEDRNWCVHLDPESEYRWTAETAGMVKRKFKIRACRILGDDNDIWFGIRARRKLLFRRWMKWVTRVGKVGQFTPDQVGVRLIFQGEQDYNQGRAWFMGQLSTHPGGTVARSRPNIQKEENESGGDSGTSLSPHASVKFVADRIHLTIEGRLVEMQMMPAPMAANVTYSTGDENDRLYGMRRFLAFLKVLRPVELYGIDWDDPEVRTKNEQKVLAGIRTRLTTT